LKNQKPNKNSKSNGKDHKNRKMNRKNPKNQLKTSLSHAVHAYLFKKKALVCPQI